MLLLIDMAGAEPKYYVPNSRNKHLVHNGVLILPLLLSAGLNPLYLKLDKQVCSQKGLFNLTPGCIVDGDFCVPNEIES